MDVEPEEELLLIRAKSGKILARLHSLHLYEVIHSISLFLDSPSPIHREVYANTHVEAT